MQQPDAARSVQAIVSTTQDYSGTVNAVADNVVRSSCRRGIVGVLSWVLSSRGFVCGTCIQRAAGCVQAIVCGTQDGGRAAVGHAENVRTEATSLMMRRAFVRRSALQSIAERRQSPAAAMVEADDAGID